MGVVGVNISWLFWEFPIIEQEQLQEIIEQIFQKVKY
jgi:hypothetical protein